MTAYGRGHHAQSFTHLLRADALKGGGSGVPAIVPGQSSQSLLIKYVSGLDKDVIMPPAGARLKPAEIELLRAWSNDRQFGAAKGDWKEELGSWSRWFLMNERSASQRAQPSPRGR